MKKLKLMLIPLAVIFGIVTFMPSHVYADAAGSIQTGINDAGGHSSGNGDTIGTRVREVINILLYLLGAIAVIMIIIGGIRYTTSNGDSSNTKAAKDTILYAVVGLVIAILAYSIVNFVVSSF